MKLLPFIVERRLSLVFEGGLARIGLLLHIIRGGC